MPKGEHTFVSTTLDATQKSPFGPGNAIVQVVVQDLGTTREGAPTKSARYMVGAILHGLQAADPSLRQAHLAVRSRRVAAYVFTQSAPRRRNRQQNHGGQMCKMERNWLEPKLPWTGSMPGPLFTNSAKHATQRVLSRASLVTLPLGTGVRPL
jgi:hypothetical protein